MELSEGDLRTVFDAFDEGGKGFISTDRFVLLAREYFQSANKEGEESASILKALDPAESGLIDYDAFCRGVKRIQEATKDIISKQQTPATATLPFVPCEQVCKIASDDDTHSNGTSESTFNEYDDSALTDMSEDSSPSLLINDLPLSPFDTPSTSSSISHREGDMNGEQDDTDHLDGDSSLSLNSGHSSPLALQKDGEAQFEDFGESDIGIEIDVHDIPTALDATDVILNNGHSPANSFPFPSVPGKLFILKRDIWSQAHQENGPIKRVTSKECATELYRSTSSNHLPSGAADEAYGEYAASDSDIMELTDKVRDLELQVMDLEKDRVVTDELQLKMRSDNNYLQKQKDQLEEQLKELDQSSDDTLREKESKHSQVMVMKEKEFQQELTALQNRLSVLQIENDKLEKEIAQYKPQVTALTHKSETLEAQLQEADGNWLSLSVEIQKRDDDHKIEKEELEDVIHNSNTMIDDLSKQLETLQANHKTELERQDALMRSPSIADLPSRFTELKQEVHQLRTENQHLKETNDEISVQLLNSSVTIGRSLLHRDANKRESFAAEMESSSRDEVVQALTEEKKITRDLRTYIGKILEKVIQKHPELLEIELVPEARGGASSSSSEASSNKS